MNGINKYFYTVVHDIHFPEQLSGADLDEYLSKGWYRMGQVIFTTNYIVYEEFIYRVFWVRYDLNDIHFTRSHQKIILQNKDFDVSLHRYILTAEMEELYAEYRSSVTFEAPESVAHFLHDGGPGNAYDSYCFEIRDKGQLIAVGVFDNGNNSFAGIMNFYHPAYKKYSLGKYLMLLKVKHAIATGKKWYYPGYIVAGNPRFDYKLFLGKDIASIWFPETGEWLSYAQHWPGE